MNERAPSRVARAVVGAEVMPRAHVTVTNADLAAIVNAARQHSLRLQWAALDVAHEYGADSPAATVAAARADGAANVALAVSLAAAAAMAAATDRRAVLARTADELAAMT